MPVTVRNTDILFNDGSTQSTAAGAVTTAAVLNATAGASFGGVGTYAVLMMAANTNLAAGATIAGSSLRDVGIGGQTQLSTPYNGGQTVSGPSYPFGGTAMSGTWRKMSAGVTHGTYAVPAAYGTMTTAWAWAYALYLRIS
jgi:hypothetical protein